jgi:Fic family protein
MSMRGREVTLTWQHDPTIHAPAKYRRACRYTAFIPDPLQGWSFKLDADVAGVAAEAEGVVRELNARALPAPAPLARLLLRTESIASSKVEGMQLGARELARAEARMETGEKVGTAATGILSNIDAMQLAIDEAASADRFSPDEVLRIHEKLMERFPTAHFGGRLRMVQNWIGGNDNPCGADFVPPPPEYVPDLLADLCEAVNDDLLPPIVQAAIVHGQFETIHPFDDGNGRTGRALIHVVLRRRGVTPAYVPPISVVLAGSKDRYIRGLVDFRNGEFEAWIDQFAAATLRAGRLASEYLEAVRDLMGLWRDRLAAAPDTPRADAGAWAIIDVLPAHPIVTASVAAAATGRSKPQVYRALEQLEAAGVLERASKGRRNRSWEATGLLDLIAGLEAGEFPATWR